MPKNTEEYAKFQLKTSEQILSGTNVSINNAKINQMFFKSNLIFNFKTSYKMVR